MAPLVTLNDAKIHLRITSLDHEADIYAKVKEASETILRRLHGRRITVSSLTASSGIATLLTATVHGLTTNDSVTVWGATQPEYNGIWNVTVVDTTSITYAISGTPVSPATGAIGLRTAESWTATTVPGPVRSAVLILLTHLFEDRGDQRYDSDSDELVWNAIDRLLVTYRYSALA